MTGEIMNKRILQCIFCIISLLLCICLVNAANTDSRSSLDNLKIQNYILQEVQQHENEHQTKAMAYTRLKRITKKIANLPGLYVKEGKLMKQGKPYSAIGVNYFDAFYRVLKDPNDKTYQDGFKVLKGKYQIPFVRFMAGGYWPSDWEIYLENKPLYFELMDEFISEAEKQEIGLIPSLFWYIACVPDIVGEPMDQLGNPESKTIEFIRTYTNEVVSRYYGSPAIWAWEFGNEHLLYTDIPRDDSKLSFGRADIVPEFGTPEIRSERDRFRRNDLITAYSIFSKEVRKIDTHRMLSTGDATPPENAYHRSYKNNWELDTRKEWRLMLESSSPEKIDSLSIHVYPHQDKLYFKEKIDIEKLISFCNTIAIENGKPLFVGEFGAPKTIENTKEFFFKSLNAIEKFEIPLSALWVYDLPSQNDSWNVTENNNREYMLEAIKETNSKIQK